MDNCNYDDHHQENIQSQNLGFCEYDTPYDPHSAWTYPKTFGSLTYMKDPITFASYSQSASLRRRRQSGRDFIKRFSALSLEEQPYSQNCGTIRSLSDGVNTTRSYYNYSFPSYYSSTAVYAQTSWHSQVVGFHQQKGSPPLSIGGFHLEKPRPTSYPFASRPLFDIHAKETRTTAVGSVKPRQKSPDFENQFDSKCWTKRRNTFSEDFSDDDEVCNARLKTFKTTLIDGEKVKSYTQEQKTNQEQNCRPVESSFFRSTTFIISMLLNLVLMSWLLYINYEIITDRFWMQMQNAFAHVHLVYENMWIWMDQLSEIFKTNHNFTLGLNSLNYVKLLYYDPAFSQQHSVDDTV